MNLSDRSQFGLKVFNQPFSPQNTIIAFCRHYKSLLDFGGHKDSSYMSFEIFALLGSKALNAEFTAALFSDLEKDNETLHPQSKAALSLMNSNRYFYLQPEVLDLAKKIRLNNFRTQYLQNLPMQKSTYLLNKTTFFRFFKTDTELVGGLFSKDEDSDSYDIENHPYMSPEDCKAQKEYGFNFNLFRIDLANNSIMINGIEYDDMQSEKFLKEIQYPIYKEFVQLLLFICLSDVRIDILEPNGKIGKVRSDKIMNSSNSNVIVVGSKWNVISVRTEGFKVNGHFRLQPCGQNCADVKLIYIDTYQKHGYIRKSNKQINNY